MSIKLKSLDCAVISGMLLYSASATITPICLLAMAHDLNFSLSAGGGIEAMRSLLIFFALFACGFVAARIGKVRSLAGGLFFLSLGYALYALAPSYPAVLVASVIIGLASGMLEGLLNPLVVDIHPNDSGRYLNITNAFWSVGVLSTVILAGDLLTRGVSWRLMLGFLSASSLVMGIVMSTLHKKEPTRHGLSFKQVLNHYSSCLRSKRFLVFCSMMFFAGGAEGAFTFWSASYIQVNFATNPRMAGVGTACFAAGMVTMRLLSGFLVGQKRLRRLILASAIAACIVASAIPFVQTITVFFPILFLSGMTIACFWPSIQSYAVDRIPHIDPTLAFILMSCAGVPGFGFITLIMGFIGDAVGLNKSFFIVPVLLAILAIIVLMERNRGPQKVIAHE